MLVIELGWLWNQRCLTRNSIELFYCLIGSMVNYCNLNGSALRLSVLMKYLFSCSNFLWSC